MFFIGLLSSQRTPAGPRCPRGDEAEYKRRLQIFHGLALLCKMDERRHNFADDSITRSRQTFVKIVCFIPCDKRFKYNGSMELRQIRSFLSIAETLHFGRTAELVHLSQPALSLQIRALEEEIGVRLFERNRRKTTLTAAGFAFREAAAAAVLQLDQAIRRATLAANGKLGLLSIGFISTAGSELVPNVIRLFRELNPDVQFSLRNILTADQIRMLEAGSLDIGFLRLPIGGHSQLEVVTVHRESFVLVVPSRHKLAKRKRVRLSEVASQDFVMYERTHAPGFHDLVFVCFAMPELSPCQSDCGGNAHADLAGGCRNGSFHPPRFGGQT